MISITAGKQIPEWEQLGFTVTPNDAGNFVYSRPNLEGLVDMTEIYNLEYAITHEPNEKKKHNMRDRLGQMWPFRHVRLNKNFMGSNYGDGEYWRIQRADKINGKVDPRDVYTISKNGGVILPTTLVVIVLKQRSKFLEEYFYTAKSAATLWIQRMDDAYEYKLHFDICDMDTFDFDGFIWRMGIKDDILELQIT